MAAARLVALLFAGCSAPDAELAEAAHDGVLDREMQAFGTPWGHACGVLASDGNARGRTETHVERAYPWRACGAFCFSVGPEPWAQDVYVMPEGDGWRVEVEGLRYHAYPGCDLPE